MAKKEKDYTEQELKERKTFFLKGLLILSSISILIGGGVGLVIALM